MAKPFTMYWSNFKYYEECPRKFLWYRGWGDIDLGRGPGKGKEKPEEFSQHHILMGQVTQKAIELMYNDELWRTPATLKGRLEALTKLNFESQLAKSYIDWKRSPSRIELLEVCVNGVMGYLKTMKQHKLIGSYARAEKELFAFINKYTPIGGRVDLIVRREDTGVSILDGKNGKHKGKYLDADQLRWYALCYYLCYSALPDRLGWVYYRFPYGTPALNGEEGEIEEGVEWVDFTLDDLKGLSKRALEVRHCMDKQQFEPTPSPKVCQWCEFNTVCPERIAQKEANKRTKKSDDVPLPSKEDGFGFDEF